MKIFYLLLLKGLLLPVLIFAQTGSSCADPFVIIMDGVCKDYATSASSGTSSICTSYTGSSPITFFSFTTNSLPDKVLMNITAPGGQPCEIVMYTSGSCSPALSASSMCFDDGEGLWAPAHNFVYSPNTTYKLRIKTAIAGNITICAQHYTPPNDVCTGAFPIGPTPQQDNNSCHTPGPDVIAGDLCAGSLENTAFYKYTVESTGVSIINFNNIACDNGNGNNNNGLQVGFFTGTCGALVPISCYSSAGAFISAVTSSLAAGTVVYVAVDGASGSNCSYEINAINAVPLVINLKYFSSWKNSSSNLLKWVVLEEKAGGIYEIQRSENGRDFFTIGRVESRNANSVETEYRYEDKNPPVQALYRLRYTTADNKVTLSRIIEMKRDDMPFVKIAMSNPVDNIMRINIYSGVKGIADVHLFNLSGQVVFRDRILCEKGSTIYTKTIAALTPGQYFVNVNLSGIMDKSKFIKFNQNAAALIK